jgi:hypothetical protein
MSENYSEVERLRGVIEWAWTILANVSDGDWTKQSPEWQEAVANWRDKEYGHVSSALAQHTPPLDESQLKGIRGDA